MQAKRDRLCAGLEAAGLEVFRPDGTYFVTADIRPLGEADGHAFCLALPERAGVVAVPTVVFYDDKEVGRPLIRFAFCKRDEVIDEAAARLSGLAGVAPTLPGRVRHRRDEVRRHLRRRCRAHQARRASASSGRASRGSRSWRSCRRAARRPTS